MNEDEKSYIVNIDEWMYLRHGEKPSVDQYADLLEHEIEKRQELVERWELLHARKAREERLDSEPKECSGCGKLERHYREDYVCWQCRDALDNLR